MSSPRSFISSHSDLNVDRSMRRLLDLTVNVKERERDVDEILAIINDEAPNLLNGLAMSNIRQIARTLQLKVYNNHDVVFRQNEPPDAYYTVLRGAVSIYFKHPTAPSEPGTSAKRAEYGRFLVQLRQPAGFGELSFQGDFKHTARNAGVVSDGDGLDDFKIGGASSPGSPSTHIMTTPKGTHKRRVCILLLIPEKTYMSEMYALHASKNQTKDKIALLKKSFLFASWSIDQLVKLAYGMKKKEFKKGDKIIMQGDRVENIFIMTKGKVKITISNEIDLAGVNGAKTGMTNKVVDIAELEGNDIFGLVEYANNSHTMTRTFTANTNVEVYLISASLFSSLMQTSKETKSFVLKIVEKRKYWERLRVDYANNFPSMKCTLPANAAEMSQYSLCKESVMNEAELRDLKEKRNQVFTALREARATYRSAIIKIKYKKTEEAVADLELAKTSIMKAVATASLMNDEEISEQANDTMHEITEQLDIHKNGGADDPANAVRRESARARRGSAALVAMRLRTLSTEKPVSPKVTDTKPLLPGSRGRRKTDAQISTDVARLNRETRRSSIAQLAAAAGLKEEFGNLEEIRQSTAAAPSHDELPRRSRRASAAEIQNKGMKLESLLLSPAHNPKRPNQPNTASNSGGGSRRGSNLKSSTAAAEGEPDTERDGSGEEGEKKVAGSPNLMTRIKRKTLGALNKALS